MDSGVGIWAMLASPISEPIMEFVVKESFQNHVWKCFLRISVVRKSKLDAKNVQCFSLVEEINFDFIRFKIVLGNACYYSVQNLLSSHLISKKPKD
jgi:hypothetical protein